MTDPCHTRILPTPHSWLRQRRNGTCVCRSGCLTQPPGVWRDNPPTKPYILMQLMDLLASAKPCFARSSSCSGDSVSSTNQQIGTVYSQRVEGIEMWIEFNDHARPGGGITSKSQTVKPVRITKKIATKRQQTPKDSANITAYISRRSRQQRSRHFGTCT